MSVIEKLSKNYRTYQERLDDIRKDWTLSDEAKRQTLQDLYSKHLRTHEELAAEHRRTVAEKAEDTRKRAFKAPKTGGVAALDMLSYRDALDRVGRTREPRELQETLDRARWTGDKALAKAVLYRGYELQNRGIVQSYFQANPDDLPVWEGFMNSAEELNHLRRWGLRYRRPISLGRSRVPRRPRRGRGGPARRRGFR
jgi:hypothetical protein